VDRRDRLARARLYLVCDAGALPVVEPALRGGVDLVQLRDKALDDEGLVAAAAAFRARCRAHGALFVLNDRPDLVAAAGADGVHVGQDDMPVAEARALVGPERLVGLSTHAPAQLAAARGVDYVAVGPVHPTPTKPGRPAAGLRYVRHAAAHPPAVPWFAIGGIDLATIGDVVAAGASRVVVVRALTQAADPEGTARALRAALAREEAGVGAA
jgi:thiamine-phosphate pyrophosphorylase